MEATPDRNPLDGRVPELLARYAVTTAIGRKLRRADAAAHLREMEAAEATIQQEEQQLTAIRDQIAHMQAQHELNMQYLIEIGVSADERATFSSILQEVVRHGGLTLREAAALAHAMHEEGSAANAGGEVEPAVSPESGAVGGG